MQFRLRACDPGGTFCELEWEAAIAPRIGDTLMLVDYTGGDQDVTVSEVVLHRDGRVDVWLGCLGWEAGSVCSLFNSSRSAAD